MKTTLPHNNNILDECRSSNFNRILQSNHQLQKTSVSDKKINETTNVPINKRIVVNCITAVKGRTYKIRSTDAEVDDVGDGLTGVTLPLSAADTFRETSHLIKDAVYIRHHLSSATLSYFLVGGLA